MVSRATGSSVWGRFRVLLALILAVSCADDPGNADLGETLEGVFHAYVVDHEDGSSREVYALGLDSGEDVELSFATAPDLHSGERVTLHGTYTANTHALSSRDDLRTGEARFVVTRVEPASLGVAHEALLMPPKVTVRNAIVLLDFRGQAPQDYTKATAEAELSRMRAYYDEMSYGSWTMASDVFGPYLVDAPSQCNLSVLANLGKQAARARGVAIDGYDHVGVKIAGIPGLNCPCGVAYLGGTPAQGPIRNGKTSLYTCKGANVFAHELGHGIGLHHASTAPCQGKAYRAGLQGCDVVEYGNRFNTMGNGLGHFSAMQKVTLGWLGGCNIRQVARTGTFDLTAIESAAHNSIAQALQIDTGDMKNGEPLYFYVEYRNPELATFHATEQNGVRRERGPGLHISVSRDFRARNGEGRTILLDASRNLTGFPGNGAANGDPRLTTGRVFRPNERVAIELLSRTDSVAKVKVTITGGSGNNDACPNGVPTNEPEPEPAPVDAGVTDAGSLADAGVIVDEGDGFHDDDAVDASTSEDASTTEPDWPESDGVDVERDGEVDAPEPPVTEPRPSVKPDHAGGCSTHTDPGTSTWWMACLLAASALVLARRRSN